ncbi:hypothetical protein HYN49_03965 [Flavobacterium pallidum]|uniref:Uncharacterized protein n=1 Tax=Flavobacterium pallidum TaxID=2172098 RepID=A0A2S1SFJ6_9FLAO|nr:hypothetical protein HYN49_03965 [Flavobacterium pallidum]
MCNQKNLRFQLIFIFIYFIFTFIFINVYNAIRTMAMIPGFTFFVLLFFSLAIIIFNVIIKLMADLNHVLGMIKIYLV